MSNSVFQWIVLRPDRINAQKYNGIVQYPTMPVQFISSSYVLGSSLDSIIFGTNPKPEFSPALPLWSPLLSSPLILSPGGYDKEIQLRLIELGAVVWHYKLHGERDLRRFLWIHYILQLHYWKGLDHAKFIFSLNNRVCRRFPQGGDEVMFHVKEFALYRT